MTSKRRYSAEDVSAAKAYLAKRVTPNSEIYFLQRTSKTGARRYLQAFVVSDGQIIRVTHYIARACDFGIIDAHEIVINGGGFSATDEVADSLSRVLFGEGGQLRDEML